MRRARRLRARASELMPGQWEGLGGRGAWDYPILERGLGAEVRDVDGRAYLDFTMGWGSALLGHAHPAVARAVAAWARRGGLQTSPHPLQVEVAERLLRLIPGAQAVRFGKNGSDATSLAARIARAATGREAVLVNGYHGWHDWCAAAGDRRRGIPRSAGSAVASFSLEDPAGLERLLRRFPGGVAAVFADVREDPGTRLAEARELARRHGALFVLDEILTGFRLARGGAQELWDVGADMVCLGKALANGLALSALVGRRELLNEIREGVLYAPTFEAEPLSLAAAAAALGIMARTDVPRHVWRLGRRLQDGVAGLRPVRGHRVSLAGLPPRLRLEVSRDGRPQPGAPGLLSGELMRRGVLAWPAVLPSLAHTDSDVDRLLAALDRGMRRLWQ